MGQYKYIEGDLLKLFEEGEFDAIVHGCNCHNVMGAGIAKTIADKYPQALQADADYIIPKSYIDRLGNLSVSTVIIKGRKRFIINAYTQYNPGKDLDYNALELVLKKINQRYKPEKIGLPLIGCGLAGGDWKVVEKLIKRQLKDCDVTVVEYKP